ncbi:MAG: TM2 domain-containing protein [Ginsengibacter sp.]
MQYQNGYTDINPILLKLLYDITPEELYTINARTSGFSDNQINQFCVFYRSKRKDPQIILLLTLIGLVGVAGIQRFLLDQIGMGILYFLTAGLCLIGTIVDAVNYKSLAMEYNSKKIAETLALLNMIK